MKKKYPYFWKFKLFVKEYLIGTDKAIENNIDLINSLRILKNRQEKKDNRNSELSFKNRNGKTPKALDNLIIICDEKANTNKKITLSN